MNKWQPIETAPKDGMEILLGRVGSGTMDFFRWFDGTNEWLDRTADPPGWVPTHWMDIESPSERD